jgi:hypothetical protein
MSVTGDMLATADAEASYYKAVAIDLQRRLTVLLAVTRDARQAADLPLDLGPRLQDAIQKAEESYTEPDGPARSYLRGTRFTVEQLIAEMDLGGSLGLGQSFVEVCNEFDLDAQVAAGALVEHYASMEELKAARQKRLALLNDRIDEEYAKEPRDEAKIDSLRREAADLIRVLSEDELAPMKERFARLKQILDEGLPKEHLAGD